MFNLLGKYLPKCAKERERHVETNNMLFGSRRLHREGRPHWCMRGCSRRSSRGRPDADSIRGGAARSRPGLDNGRHHFPKDAGFAAWNGLSGEHNLYGLFAEGGHRCTLCSVGGRMNDSEIDGPETRCAWRVKDESFRHSLLPQHAQGFSSIHALYKEWGASRDSN